MKYKKDILLIRNSMERHASPDKQSRDFGLSMIEDADDSTGYKLST